MINYIIPISIALVRTKSNGLVLCAGHCSFHFDSSFADSRLRYSSYIPFVMIWARCLFWIGLHDQFDYTYFYSLGQNKIKWASPMCRAVLLSLRQLLCGQQAALLKLHSPCRFVASVLRVMVWASFSREIKRSVQVLIRDSQAYSTMHCVHWYYILLISDLLPLPLGLTMTALFTESVQFSIRVQSGLNLAECRDS